MKKTVYDKHYLKEDYFGKPYQILIDFFQSYTPKGTILDLGCGQGRDTLALGKLGYKVIGVDHSIIGINQLNKTAQEHNLNVVGQAADLYNYRIEENIDIVLLDSILHFYKNDIERETNLVKRILIQIKAGGLFCNCMIRGKKREDLLNKIVDNDSSEWQILFNDYVDYPKFNSSFHMIVLRKLNELREKS